MTRRKLLRACVVGLLLALGLAGVALAHAQPWDWRDGDWVGDSYVTSGNYVRSVQSAIWSYDDDCLKQYGIDGYWGSETKGCVKSYQNYHSLTVDGIVGTQTWGNMRYGRHLVSGRYVYHLTFDWDYGACDYYKWQEWYSTIEIPYLWDADGFWKSMFDTESWYRVDHGWDEDWPNC